jgi:hypothetical protein
VRQNESHGVTQRYARPDWTVFAPPQRPIALENLKKPDTSCPPRWPDESQNRNAAA